MGGGSVQRGQGLVIQCKGLGYYLKWDLTIIVTLLNLEGNRMEARNYFSNTNCVLKEAGVVKVVVSKLLVLDSQKDFLRVMLDMR